ncbi:hypothetical protein Pan44_07530 [Caulifigura coniformis]|uniref:Uncharacterized protein n=1 Tax=Caulifigura coniformis TaxID=2527983 RepID=A0A517S9E2_9PLAN|nr:hypothetical protein [Caulifigura coniformis]QDT52741.1 hypothetical protein Pan44_07530 [Caulifigura coniformis]
MCRPRKVNLGCAGSRADLCKATGIPRGWSKLLVAATKSGLGRSGKHSLEGRSYIASTKAEGSPTLSYTITAAGSKALVATRPLPMRANLTHHIWKLDDLFGEAA